MHILVVEDDLETAGFLTRALREAGHTVDHACDGARGHEMASVIDFDVLIIDRMLPRCDGLAILKRLRKAGTTTPALVLSALGNVDDRVAGLEAGGDDYLPKPFAFRELLARVECLARRPRNAAPQSALAVGDLVLDRLSRTVRRAGKEIALQPREFQLLDYLMQNAGKIVTRTMLLEKVWDYHFDPQTNVIDVHVSRLRAKIDRDFDPPLLHTVRGAGYMLREHAR